MSLEHIRGSGMLRGKDQKENVMKQGPQNGGLRLRMVTGVLKAGATEWGAVTEDGHWCPESRGHRLGGCD